MSRWSLLFLPLLLAAGPAAPDPSRVLAGRYYEQFPDGTVDGGTYTGKDIVEIVPVAPRAAYVRAHLDFYNGHQCDISGIATALDAMLVYHDPEPPLGSSPPCVLRVSHVGRSLKLDDGDGGCKTYCGARGGFARITLPFASRRPIAYLARLKASREYRDALAAWKR